MTLADGLIIGLYAAALLWIGAVVGGGHSSVSDLTLGGRKLPRWAVLCSMTATELSAATFIGVPHAAYTGDWSYLQLAVGALAAKGLLGRYVIPLYHRLGIVTVYGFLSERFGAAPRRAAALCFVVGRLLASGVRLFIAALALAAVSDVSLELAILGAGVVAGAYTMFGGIRAVVWTDTLQGAIFLVAAGVMLVILLPAGGGLAELLDWASVTGRSQIVHLDPGLSLTDGRALGTALIGAFFLTLATHATDHDMVQRLLTTRDGRAGGQALIGSAILNFPITLLFLMIGTGLAHFYAQAPAYDISDDARILPLFALHELPSGVRGLAFAGLFAAAMSSLDSAICAIATTWVTDIRPRSQTPAAASRAIRVASAVTCALLIGAAIAMSSYHRALAERAAGNTAGPNLVEFALSSMTIIYGGLLGIFALGLLTRRRGSQSSVVAGLATGAIVGLALFLHPLLLGQSMLAWTWWIPLSATLAFAVGATGRSQARPDPLSSPDARPYAVAPNSEEER
jgi:SSS family transporter